MTRPPKPLKRRKVAIILQLGQHTGVNITGTPLKLDNLFNFVKVTGKPLNKEAFFQKDATLSNIL